MCLVRQGEISPPTDKKALDFVIVYEEKAGVKFTGWERDGGERDGLLQLWPHKRDGVIQTMFLLP